MPPKLISKTKRHAHPPRLREKAEPDLARRPRSRSALFPALQGLVRKGREQMRELHNPGCNASRKRITRRFASIESELRAAWVRQECKPLR